MMILVVQNNRAMLASPTKSRRVISAEDTANVERSVASLPAVEPGYYDVLLLKRSIRAAEFSEWAMQIPKEIYDNAVDSIILIK